MTTVQSPSRKPVLYSLIPIPCFSSFFPVSSPKNPPVPHTSSCVEAHFGGKFLATVLDSIGCNFMQLIKWLRQTSISTHSSGLFRHILTQYRPFFVNFTELRQTAFTTY